MIWNEVAMAPAGFVAPVVSAVFPGLPTVTPLNRSSAGDRAKGQAGQCDQPKGKRLERGANHDRASCDAMEGHIRIHFPVESQA